MADNNRTKLLAKAYSRATQELRTHHADEFHEILQEIYDDMGIEVRKRLTGERKRAADIAKLRETLAALESDQ